MITDEELTTELTRALRSGTEHLAYTGRTPRPRRPAAVTVVPLAASAAAVGVLGWAALTAGGPATPASDAPHATGTLSAPDVLPPSPELHLVTEEVELAGMTFSYTRGVDEPPLGSECPHDYEPTGDPATRPCYVALWSMKDEVPPGAEEFQIQGITVWVAKDPEIGWSALYLEAGGDIVAILSKERSLDQMKELAASMRLV